MGKNPIEKIGYGNLAGLALIAVSVMLATSLIGYADSSNNPAGTGNSAVMETICNIFSTIKNVIFILGLALMVLGGAIYAGANLMPSQSRGAFQGYGMAMVVGGIVGVAIAVAAPFILNTVIGVSGSSGAVLASGTPGGSVVTSSICTGYGSTPS